MNCSGTGGCREPEGGGWQDELPKYLKSYSTETDKYRTMQDKLKKKEAAVKRGHVVGMASLPLFFSHQGVLGPRHDSCPFQIYMLILLSLLLDFTRSRYTILTQVYQKINNFVSTNIPCVNLKVG